MDPIIKSDLELINTLSSRTYTSNTLMSNATKEEKANLKHLKLKLKRLAQFFANKYSEDYGPFKVSISSGNDITIGGTKFGRIWSGFYKGAENKQYAAQISFVMNPSEPCIDVGFFFGRASTHNKNYEERIKLEEQLRSLGANLSSSLKNDSSFQKNYMEIFDFGFSAYSGGKSVSPLSWSEQISSDAKSSHIMAKIYANDFGVIEISTIDSYIAQVIFLMAGISEKTFGPNRKLKPKTPEQRAKLAERLSAIGTKGELFLMEHEYLKLSSWGKSNTEYPRHVALESDGYGFDILSLDEKGKEIFIEVKTTTRKKEDDHSRQFYISSNEYQVFEKNKSKYKLIRVYDIENTPTMEEVDLTVVEKIADGYVCRYTS